ncbi:putative Amino-acid N-acetyltransferase subunit Mak10 [Taphrina deformans PYCC 5710]|uniref:Amino-acid N-acetyltransferase subunit Mak10 n=1 Tax=Taphrina deformans (strain PYCC 5710 / ATCC 11124 / CBS 356.35 / IMI 108563 / JCM 9778 / NBRC 8474) TaxID=1097556 RepID=R4X6B0_TAPDE|nr:putative Amino-acid N-acetyltransferase subunit Mak10 [Taphrina deformans PYCC 5710]|eukprot:CCG80564.1 putative Amino-acid N-acetyltransferase subunit Mak10 [Taphrina deformans PYCC 5710]
MFNAFSGLSLNGAESSGFDVEDITEQYFSACRNGLAIGELVREEQFSLQDAIAALEIMDPKMDNGVIDVLEQNTEKYDISTPLSPGEIITIMDQLFACEMTWHTGSSLSQTLYTCVYLQEALGKTSSIQKFSAAEKYEGSSLDLLDRVLYPFVVAVIKQTESLREEYLTGYLYEEEDVSSADFGLDLLPYESAGTVITDLRNGLAWLQEAMGKSRNDNENSELGQLELRLQTRLYMQELFENLEYPEEWQAIVPRLLKNLSNIKYTNTQLDSLKDIFNTKIQRTLISTSPPRPIMSLSVEEAYSLLQRTCSDLLRLLPITTAAKASPACMLAFFEIIRKDNPQSLPLVRSRLQNLFLSDKMAQHASKKKQFLTAAIQEVVGERHDLFDMKFTAVELPGDKRFKINEIVTNTLARLELPYLDYFKILCHNPGRQRRNLCKILTDFDILQAESEEADQSLAMLCGEVPKLLSNGHTSLSFPISSWVFSTKLDISTTILLCGFEADLYRPFEWVMMYWQLDNILYLHYEHLGSLIMDRLPAQSRIRAHLAHRLLYIDVLRLLSKAYVRVLAALDVLGVLKWPDLKFSSKALLYKHRMAPFSKLISPPPVPYETFVAETRFERQSGTALLNQAGEYFSLARTKLNLLSKRGGPSPLLTGVPALVEDFKSHLKGLLGCCISNSLMVSRLVKEQPPWYTNKVMKWDNTKFSRHFPIISIVER